MPPRAHALSRALTPARTPSVAHRLTASRVNSSTSPPTSQPVTNYNSQTVACPHVTCAPSDHITLLRPINDLTAARSVTALARQNPQSRRVAQATTNSTNSTTATPDSLRAVPHQTPLLRLCPPCRLNADTLNTAAAQPHHPYNTRCKQPKNQPSTTSAHP